MESQRNIIIIGLAVVSYLLFIAWQQDYNSPSEEHQISNAEEFPTKNDIHELPTTDRSTVQQEQNKTLINIETDVLKIQIDPRGGDIVLGQLKAYPLVQQDQDTPITILQN